MALVLTLGVAVVAGLIIQQLAKATRKPKLHMPYLDFKNGDNSMQHYFDDSKSILERGYQQYLKKGLPFSMFNCMDVSKPMAVLPIKYLEEVRNASSTKLDFATLLNKVRCTLHCCMVPLKVRLYSSLLPRILGGL